MPTSAAAQVRFALSVGLGVRFAPWSLDRLLEAVRDTHREFGEIGADDAELLRGPELEEETRRDMQLRRIPNRWRGTARETAYYESLFERLDLDPRRLIDDDLLRISLTRKDALREEPMLLCGEAERPHSAPRPPEQRASRPASVFQPLRCNSSSRSRPFLSYRRATSTRAMLFCSARAPAPPWGTPVSLEPVPASARWSPSGAR